MEWRKKIIAAHMAVTSAVSHQGRIKSDRYFVWQEEKPDVLIADNRHIERKMTGSTDLCTKLEEDPWVDALGQSFDEHGISWELNSIQYEPDTGFTHYEWLWVI